MGKDALAEQPAGEAEEPEPLGYSNVALMIDEMTMTALIREGDVMRDSDVDATIRRRLTDGLCHAVALGAEELRWRPIRRDAARYDIYLNASILAELDSWAAEWGYDREVVVATLLSDEQCKPFEVAARERHLGYGNAADEVRREPGRGNIYPVNFHMAGYQLVFIRMLAGENDDKALILEEALLALAKQVVRGELVVGRSVSDEAYLFARRMVNWAPKPQSNSNTVRRRP